MTQSLGQVSKWFVEKHCGEGELISDPAPGEDEAVMSLGFHLRIDGLPDQLSWVVSERNRFIHHFFF